ncbi:hypothetical protein D6D13_00679 [Aureobasidium pullulans]|uniref:Uncharacterized protein n=1 Tax=Aureobasidium pullulans TaxID=5580 RepID=A0A4V4J2R0_AURPU|nr:hypothetical protein D6D13_00679 [Aureobasidium pullulans]
MPEIRSLKMARSASTSDPQPNSDTQPEHPCFTGNEIAFIQHNGLDVPTTSMISKVKHKLRFYTPALLLEANLDKEGDLGFWAHTFEIFDQDFTCPEPGHDHDPDPENDEDDPFNPEGSWADDMIFTHLPDTSCSGQEMLAVLIANPPEDFNSATERFHPREGCPFGRDARWLDDQDYDEIKSLEFNVPQDFAFRDLDKQEDEGHFRYYTPYLLINASREMASDHEDWSELLSVVLGKHEALRLLKRLGYGDSEAQYIRGKDLEKALTEHGASQKLPGFELSLAKAFKTHPVIEAVLEPEPEPESTGAEDQVSEIGDSGAGSVVDLDNNGDEAQDKKPKPKKSGAKKSGAKKSGAKKSDTNKPKGQTLPSAKRECLTLRTDEFELPYPLLPMPATSKKTNDGFVSSVPKNYTRAMDPEIKIMLVEDLTALMAMTSPRGTAFEVNKIKVKDRAVYLGNKYPATYFTNGSGPLTWANKVHDQWENLISGRKKHSPDLRMALFGHNEKDVEVFKQRVLEVLTRAHSIAEAQEWAATRQTHLKKLELVKAQAQGQFVYDGDYIPAEFRIPKDGLPMDGNEDQVEKAKRKESALPPQPPALVPTQGQGLSRQRPPPTQTTASPPTQGQVRPPGPRDQTSPRTGIQVPALPLSQDQAPAPFKAQEPTPRPSAQDSALAINVEPTDTAIDHEDQLEIDLATTPAQTSAQSLKRRREFQSSFHKEHLPKKLKTEPLEDHDLLQPGDPKKLKTEPLEDHDLLQPGDPNQSEDHDQLVATYRSTVADEKTKVAKGWSDNFHDRLGVAQGDFTAQATLAFAGSPAMTRDQRKLLSQLQMSCKTLTAKEINDHLSHLVLTAFHQSSLEIKETFRLSRARWIVTGAIAVYKDRELTAAHALTVVYVKHGQQAMDEAARALAAFKVWSPGVIPVEQFGDLSSPPINTFLLGKDIATAMWPELLVTKASHVRRADPTNEELTKMPDAEAAKLWPESHRSIVATVMQKDRISGEYPVTETIHVDTTQSSESIDNALTGKFFINRILPSLREVWGDDLDAEALWSAVMTDGKLRNNPWTKQEEQGSTLPAMRRAKIVKKMKLEEVEDEKPKPSESVNPAKKTNPKKVNEVREPIKKKVRGSAKKREPSRKAPFIMDDVDADGTDAEDSNTTELTVKAKRPTMAKSTSRKAKAALKAKAASKAKAVEDPETDDDVPITTLDLSKLDSTKLATIKRLETSAPGLTTLKLVTMRDDSAFPDWLLPTVNKALEARMPKADEELATRFGF